MTQQITAVAQVTKIYNQPKTEILPLTEQALGYLTNERKLSATTLAAFGVGCTKKGNIAIPFFDEKAVRWMVKFRHPTGGMLQLHGKDTKTFTEPDGKGVLLGSNLCLASEGPLILCFGDYDAMAIYETGLPNVVSLPLGDSAHDFISFQWDFLEQFKEIVIFNDADAYKNEKVRILAEQNFEKLVSRLGKHRCRLVRTSDRHGCKDANALLVAHGIDACLKAIENADWVAEDGLIKIADYQDAILDDGQPTGYTDIDRSTGGFSRGDLVIIAGDNSAGKTTIALNLIAKAVDLRVPVLLWSGEQPVGKLRYWFERIVTGSTYLKAVPRIGMSYTSYFPQEDVKPAIRDWYRDYLYQYAKFSTTKEQYFGVAELAIRRYGVQIVVIDNLMAFTGGEGDGYYQAQGDFAQSCKMFAETWGVTVILICHNRKLPKSDTKKVYIPGKDDVEGSKKVTNWADTILQMVKIEDDLQEGQYEGVQGIINLCKSRETGMVGTTALRVDHVSTRMTQMDVNYDLLRYGWENEYRGNLLT